MDRGEKRQSRKRGRQRRLTTSDASVSGSSAHAVRQQLVTDGDLRQRPHLRDVQQQLQREQQQQQRRRG